MLFQCSLIIQDLTFARPNTRPLRSYLMTKRINDIFYVCVKNSMFPNTRYYNLAMLHTMYFKFIHEGKMGLEFRDPRQALLISCEDKKMINMFFRQVQNIVAGKNVVIGKRQMPKMVPAKKDLTNRFDPMALEFVAVNRFDNRLLNMRNLSKLVLENCDLPTIPIQIGHLPIKYLSISGSKLSTSQYEQDIFWNWTSIPIICDTLTTLKIDSLDLKKLPFEIFFLKNLTTLSACNNRLSYLPQLIDCLKKLENLFVADNFLVYFPHVISHKTFNEVDISHNSFRLPTSLHFDHLTSYLKLHETTVRHGLDPDLVIKPLNHLAFFNILDSWITFKRQDIPRTLWIYFDLCGRCVLCNKWILPEYARITHTPALPRAFRIIKDYRTDEIPMQSLLCRNPHDCVKQV